ncbi:hypothetical protein Ssi03_15050 [Sphaerisporangium siamense]|uniref:AcrR family transcriptional regulator n=1 Tax=Sphaerisporangium siamense TaxID=795645 RepID=A0A7W7GBE5_9ACTN|nr:TetR/AcrR family transcriptional regulator [Sphaerisporangium siamense]MBB4702730.1 AcrR family transcriptional regulator [Sphaerisporangium siamense]GII83515.1 hypothetical protein Ssi03_15050 [Sphaerisporangium siamense]
MQGQGSRADALRNTDKIVRAAIAVLRRIGPAAPLEEIARCAGVGVATVYRRFGDRHGVVRAAFLAYLAEKVEPLARAAGEDADPRHGLDAALAAAVDALAAHHTLLAAARESGAFTVDLAERCLGPLAEVLAGAQRRGQIRADLVVRDLAAIVVMALAATRPGEPGRADARRYLALLLAGTRPSAEPLPALAALVKPGSGVSPPSGAARDPRG